MRNVGGVSDALRRAKKAPLRPDEYLITYYTVRLPAYALLSLASATCMLTLCAGQIGVRGDSKLGLVYVAQLLIASPIMWSCWNACVDIDQHHAWVKRAAFISTWWVTPASIATAVASTLAQWVHKALGTPFPAGLEQALLGDRGSKERWAAIG